MEKIYFIHEFDRSYPVYNSRTNTAGYWKGAHYVTFAYRHIDDTHIEYGYAKCNKNDSYNKAIGRSIAKERLNAKNKHYRIIDLNEFKLKQNTSLYKAFSEYTKTIPNFLTFNDFKRSRINTIVKDDYYYSNEPLTNSVDVILDIGKKHFIHVFDKNSMPAVTKSKLNGDKLRKDYTICYEFIDADTVKLAIAVCNPKEHFNKKIGRNVSAEKLDTGQNVYTVNLSEYKHNNSWFTFFNEELGIKSYVKIPIVYVQLKIVTSIIKQYAFMKQRNFCKI